MLSVSPIGNVYRVAGKREKRLEEVEYIRVVQVATNLFRVKLAKTGAWKNARRIGA